MRNAVLILFSLTTQGCTVLLAGLNEDISVDYFRDMVERAPYVAPAGIAVLSRSEILNTIIGNSLVGPSPHNGSESVEYLRPDGTVLALWRDRSSEGLWSVSRSLLCIYYPLVYVQANAPPREASLFHCFTLTLEDNAVNFFDQNGRAVSTQSQLLPGNARSLQAVGD